MNYDGPAMAQQIMRLQARVKELLDSKQHEFECFQKVNSALTDVKIENAHLQKLVNMNQKVVDMNQKVVDAARGYVASNFNRGAKELVDRFRELDAPQKGVTSPSEGVDTEKECSKCRALVEIGPCDEHAAHGC